MKASFLFQRTRISFSQKQILWTREGQVSIFRDYDINSNEKR